MATFLKRQVLVKKAFENFRGREEILRNLKTPLEFSLTSSKQARKQRSIHEQQNLSFLLEATAS